MGEDVKRMADWLRSGATMLPNYCPECSSPLFKLQEKIWCPKCNRRVVIASESETVPLEVKFPLLLANVEETVMEKIRDLNEEIRTEKDAERLQRLGALLTTWLSALEHVKRVSKP